jgi:hypothetical protein
MLIHVTQDHIDHGAKGSCTHDPIALALEDAGFYEAWAGPDKIGVRGAVKEPWVRYWTPVEVREFMILFDNDEPVEPFEFELGVIPCAA